MRAQFLFGGLAIGLAAGAAFAAADEPPPKAQPHRQQGHAAPAHQEHAGRWGAPAVYTPAHDAEAHGEGHGPQIGFRGCAYFENGDFGGRRGEIREGMAVEWLGRAWSDRISSAACHPGCRLIGYVDINYGGARRNFSGAVADLGPAWNDRISALRAVCDGAAH